MVGDILWTPPADLEQSTEVGRFIAWLREERGHDLAGYDELWRFSVTELEGFWGAIWDFFGIRAHAPYERVLARAEMPGAQWFTGARLNYGEHLVGRDEDVGRVAVLARSQTRGPIDLTFGELREQVARARSGLQRLGVGSGDRVAAYLPNIPETLVAFIATASLGAIWATCAPEFGARSVIDRFGQIEPKVLLAVGGYGYRDRHVDRRAEVVAIRERVPSIEHVVHVPYGENDLPGAIGWEALLAEPAPLAFDPVPFDAPAVRAVLLGHDRTAEGDRPLPRRPARRAPQEPGPRLGSQAGRPAAVVLDDRVDDVERTRLRAAAAQLDRDARRRPDVARPAPAVAARRGAPADGDGRRRRRT